MITEAWSGIRWRNGRMLACQYGRLRKEKKKKSSRGMWYTVRRGFRWREGWIGWAKYMAKECGTW